ncbi:hypothetical protein [Nonomuraea insulae]|uniref:Uncharacterized protein n=1 Tax=Nonomuraea insulae TaxID=1616787 RepID=A0ABW1CTQ6_9ACTN
MYKCAIAAVTMTAAALLLAATPAIADNDYAGPHGPSRCEKELAELAEFAEMGAPTVMSLPAEECAEDGDDD